jgi:hypothetical protein
MINKTSTTTKVIMQSLNIESQDNEKILEKDDKEFF